MFLHSRKHTHAYTHDKKNENIPQNNVKFYVLLFCILTGISTNIIELYLKYCTAGARYGLHVEKQINLN